VPEQAKDQTAARPITPPRWARWFKTKSVVLFLALLLIYQANDRELGVFDTVPAALLPYTIVKGDGVYLDRFEPVLRDHESQALLPFVAQRHGHIISLYPIGPGVLTVPLVIPQIWLLQALKPDWDQGVGSAYFFCRAMGKVSAGIVMAVMGVSLFGILHRLGLRRLTLPAVIAACLASDVWGVAAQAMWEHGPAALALALTIGLLSPGPPTRARLLLAGFTSAALVCFRAIDLIFAATVAAWVAYHRPRDLAWFLPAPIILGAALIAYNVWFFDSIAGGQSRLEAMHTPLHAASGPWSGNLVDGALGTLFSPSRGLFIFSPWVAFALALLPVTVRRLGPGSLVRWLFCALVPYLLVLSKYAVWWGGHCFGPRYWIDATPLFAVMLALALDWAAEHARQLILPLGLAIAWGIGVQVIGAYLYPSGWNEQPANVDLHHERLWDWSDSELTRCLGRGLEKLDRRAK
jgi:hypothetical protein